MMAMIVRAGLRSAFLSEARLALLSTSAAPSRLISSTINQSRVLSEASKLSSFASLSRVSIKVTAGRSYCMSTKLTKSNIEARVIAVCNAFDKITADKLTLDSHFINDLGLDSLDHVEIIMAMEDEFGFEIPDDHAEKLLTPAKIAQYVADHEDVYE